MEVALLGLLLTHPALNALVGSKVHWLRAPQGTVAPYVILSKISGDADGGFTHEVSLKSGRVQIDCYATTYLAVVDMAAVVKALLHRYRGSPSGVLFQGVFLDAERDLDAWAGDTVRLYRRTLDFIIHHTGD